jgi:sec-independent protein translocase protein TatA
LIVVLLVVLLVGRGKISDLMGDMAKGIKSFKQGLADDDEADTPPSKPIEHRQAEAVDTTRENASTKQ